MSCRVAREFVSLASILLVGKKALLTLLSLDPVGDASSLSRVAFLHVADRDAGLLLQPIDTRLSRNGRLSDRRLCVRPTMLIVVVDLRSLELLQEPFLHLGIGHVLETFYNEGKRLLVLQLMVDWARTCGVPTYSDGSGSALGLLLSTRIEAGLGVLAAHLHRSLRMRALGAVGLWIIIVDIDIVIVNYLKMDFAGRALVESWLANRASHEHVLVTVAT